MTEVAEKSINSQYFSVVSSFTHELNNCTCKKEIASAMIRILGSILDAQFSSFVEKDENLLRVICQLGSTSHVKSFFNKEMGVQIFNWVMSQKQVAILKLPYKEQFIFIPVLDQNKDQITEHGMLVFHLSDSTFELNKELTMTVNTLTKLTGLKMTNTISNEDSEKYLSLRDQINSDLKLGAKIQRSISGSEFSKTILFNVIEDEQAALNGNLWWVSELSTDITLVLIAQVHCKGVGSALLGGYLIGEMNGLKTKAEISLKPSYVLTYLNHKLNNVFKSVAITVNAWYGVFNLGARKVRFANANHPDPFLIGPEQQVSNLQVPSNEKGRPLGVNVDSIYTEGSSYIATGSKLIICTRDLLEHAAKVGDKYDPTWLPHLLETLGTLPLSEIRNSLDSILSGNGTAKKYSRLALLLEIPS